eukprot:CAMPEP_0113612628 /NCGR_PEP_ID=MMETSP0017_2-20120614/6202_1 /TAXON_ID=2856 /ORGANISM="Cylindrotheca closterium" /LENGTH=36 /DNA_ID=CAMNT_0000521677 /DNA_START=84 /DNA_END=194 /DNA_ORIENTATION=- /assembly_acc=CAM_ASM_000147
MEVDARKIPALAPYPANHQDQSLATTLASDNDFPAR